MQKVLLSGLDGYKARMVKYMLNEKYLTAFVKNLDFPTCGERKFYTRIPILPARNEVIK